jgi:hypothetical protein
MAVGLALNGLLPQSVEPERVELFRRREEAVVPTDTSKGSQNLGPWRKLSTIGKLNRLDNLADEGG